MLLSALVAHDFRQQFGRLPDPVHAEPTGVPGRIEVVTELTGDDPGSIALATGETFDLRAIVYDAGDGSVMTGVTVTWSSDTPGAATVDSNGVVSYAGNGSATIRAEVNTAGGNVIADLVAVTTTGPAAVASITASQTTVSGSAGGTTVLTVTPLDASGNVLSGRTVTEGSTDDTVCNAAVSGYTITLTHGVVGSATITLTCEGQTVQVVVTVVAAGAEFPNEPVSVGWEEIHNSDFTGFTTTNPAIGSTTVQGLRRDATGTSGRAVTATLAPYVGETVLDIVFSATLPQGTGPEHLTQGPYFYVAKTYLELYVCFDFMVPTGWKQPNGSTVQKLMHIWGLIDAYPTGAGGSCVVPALTGTADSTTAQVQCGLRYQGMSIVNGGHPVQSFNGAKVNINRNQWYKLEMLLAQNTGQAADGAAILLLDGTQRSALSNLKYKDGGAKEWTIAQLNPTYGGLVGTTVGTIQHLYLRKWKTKGKA